MSMNTNEEPNTQQAPQPQLAGGEITDAERIIYSKLMERLNMLTIMAMAYFHVANTATRPLVAAKIIALTDNMVKDMRADPGGNGCPNPTWTDCGNYCVPPGVQCIN